MTLHPLLLLLLLLLLLPLLLGNLVVEWFATPEEEEVDMEEDIEAEAGTRETVFFTTGVLAATAAVVTAIIIRGLNCE
jgi:hypothetical protein